MQYQQQQQQYNYYNPQQNQPPLYQEPYAAYPPQNQPPFYPQPYPAYAPAVSEPGSGQAVAGMILGIIGLIAWLLPLIGYPVSITGLVLALKGRRAFSRRTMATAGVVLSAIALGLTVLSSLIGIKSVYCKMHLTNREVLSIVH